MSSLEAIKTLYNEDDFKCPITLDWLSPDPNLYPIYGCEDGHTYSGAILKWFDTQPGDDNVKSPLNGTLMSKNTMKNPQPFTGHYLTYIKEMNIVINVPTKKTVIPVDQHWAHLHHFLWMRPGRWENLTPFCKRLGVIFCIQEEWVNKALDVVEDNPYFNSWLEFFEQLEQHGSSLTDKQLHALALEELPYSPDEIRFKMKQMYDY